MPAWMLLVSTFPTEITKGMAQPWNAFVPQQRISNEILVSTTAVHQGFVKPCTSNASTQFQRSHYYLPYICVSLAVMLDTKGPEIRTGFFKGGVDKIHLVKGEQIILTSDYTYKGDKHKLACSYEKLATSVTPGQEILVADGSLVLTVLSCDVPAGEITCRLENNTSMGERKNMNLPGVVVDLPTFTEQDIDDIVNFGIKHNVDFVAASFVRKGSDVKNLRQLLADNNGQHIKIICKIENQEGLENYDEILAATDGIMVARGDLGMEIPSSVSTSRWTKRNHSMYLTFLLCVCFNAFKSLESLFGSKNDDPQGQHCW
jgi:hypothetical protein